MTPAVFNMHQNHVDQLSGNSDCNLNSNKGSSYHASSRPSARRRHPRVDPDVLVVDHNAKFTSDMFRSFVKKEHGIAESSLIVGSAYHKNTNAKVERANDDTATRCAPTPTAVRTTGTITYRSPCLPA